VIITREAFHTPPQICKNDGGKDLLDIMKEPTTNFEPPPLSGGGILSKTCSFFVKFAAAFYSTDFLETCTNDGPHGDILSVIFSEFLRWWNEGKIHEN